MPGIAIGIFVGGGVSSLADEVVFEDDMKVSKYTFTYADLAAAALTNNGTLVVAPAGEVFHGFKAKTSTAFAGGTLATLKFTLGLLGELDRYLGKFVPYDLMAAVGGTNMGLSEGLWSESHTAATTLKWAATSTGANLDAATAGVVDVWVWSTSAA